MKIGIADLVLVSPEEKMWLDSSYSPFNMYYVSDSEQFFVFTSSREHEHFNPNGYAKFYVQHREIEPELQAAHDLTKKLAYSPVAPLYLPTGTFSFDHGMSILCCLDGFLHDASGYPACKTGLFGDEYYLHGKNYEPIDYFRYLEKEKGRYPEYQPLKYVEYMASVLGKKD